MKVKIVIIFICLMVSVMNVQCEEIFCRYQTEDGAISYGQVEKVEDRMIDQLSAAPWDGGIKTGHTISMDDVKFLHPSEPQKLFGMAGTYREAWTDEAKPFNTVRWFLKPPSSAGNPDDEVVLPAALDELMVETELVIVIGKLTKNASVEEAKDAIFGYTVGNDIVGSVSSYHKIQGEPLDQEETLLPPGLKMGDRFSPYGPFIYRGVDWNNRERTLTVTNKETGKNLVYKHNTSNLIYTPEKIVSDLSRVMSLFPGDVIFTGTTQALSAVAGDVMTVSVEGLGTIVNKVAPCRVQ